MPVGKLAKKALSWIVRILSIPKTEQGRRGFALVLGEVLGAKAEKYLAKLAKLEATKGAHTAAWSKIEKAAIAAKEQTFTVAEVQYLHEFKKLWDKHLKRPLRRLADKLDEPQIDDPEPIVDALPDDPDDDDPAGDPELADPKPEESAAPGA